MARWTLCLAIVLALWVPEVAQAQGLRVTLLGTGTPRPDPERMGPATLIEAGDEKLLFDVGRGTTVRLVQANVAPASITGVFITHLHSDHVVGLPDLWLLGHVPPWYRGRPLEVFGPEGVNGLTSGIRDAFSEDVELRANPARPGPALRATEIPEAGVVFNRNGVKVTAILVNHVGRSYAYRVDYDSRSVVVSGDASPSAMLEASASGVDLLIHEIMAIGESFLTSRPEGVRRTMQRVLGTHTTPGQAAELLSRTRPRLTVFNHISLAAISEEQVLQEVRGRYDGQVLIGEDLMSITVDKEVQIQRH